MIREKAFGGARQYSSQNVEEVVKRERIKAVNFTGTVQIPMP